MYKYLFLLFFLFAAVGVVNAKDSSKEKAKNAEQKKIDKEFINFNKALKKNPNDADAYWNHANNLLKFKNYVREAKNVYEKALELDSTNGELYKDYGKYLYEKLYLLDDAKKFLLIAKKMLGKDAETEKCIKDIDDAIKKREAEELLKDFGHSNKYLCDTTVSYAVITNFDSIKRFLFDEKSRFSYEKLLNRYLSNDETLSPLEMFYLIVGYSKKKEYNPFNYNEISALKTIAGINYDTAIKRGNELITKNPLNPSINREIMYCYRKKNDFVNAAKYQNRIKQFFDGVLYSGNGTCERPYVALWGREEYSFINYIGLKQTELHSMETCAGQMAEMIDAKDPQTDSTSKIYFNVKLIYLQTIGK